MPLDSAIQHLLKAKRISAPSQSYAKDNPIEWAKVKGYLEGGARPTGVTTEMGLGLIEVEDVRRAQIPPPPPPDGQTWLQPFAADSLWRSAIPSGAAVHANSPNMIQVFVANVAFPQVAIGTLGIAVAVTDGSDPLRSINCTEFSCAPLAANPVPIPIGTKADPGIDGHLSIWHTGTHREYDFWVYAGPSNPASTYSGGTCLTDGKNGGLDMTTGAVAVNLPMLAGTLRPEEMLAGDIPHALFFVGKGSGVGPGHVFPARKGEGSSGTANAMPEGTLVQLDPSLNVDSLSITPWEKIVARCLQRYGMYLVDTGGSGPTIYAENPINRATNPWTSFPIGNYGNLWFSGSFPWNRMRVLQPRTSW